jgi:hypothetical protein
MAARQFAAALGLAAWSTLLSAHAALGATPSPSPSAGARQTCSSQSGDPTSVVGRLGCDVNRVATQAGQAVGSAVGQAGQSVVSGAEADFTSWIGNGAAWIVQGVTQEVLSNSSTPSLDPTRATTLTQVYGRVVGVALSLSVLLVLLGIIEAALTQRPGALRRVVVGIAVSGIGLGAVPVATALLVRVTDDLSSYVIASPAQELAPGLSAIVQLLLATTPGGGTAAFALAALGMMVGGALLWLELLVRASLIYMFLGVVPLACAAVQWPRLEGVLRQVLFAGLALIVSKLVIAVVLTTGFAVLSMGNGLQSLFGGMFIILIAALMPFATARILPLAADELAMSHQGRVRGLVVRGVGTSTGLAQRIQNSRGSSDRAGVGLALPMGSPSGQGPGPSGSTPSEGGNRPGGGPPRPGPGRPRGDLPSAPAPTGAQRSARVVASPTPPPQQRAESAPPRSAPPARRHRPGAEPPRDAGAPEAK